MPYLFLSPSLQPFNEYVNGGNEQQYMNLIADAMEPYLIANGIHFDRSDENGSLRDAIKSSNMGNYDLHLALHSNAAPPSLSGVLTGTDVYYKTGSYEGENAANIIADNFKTIYPNPDKVKAVSTDSLAELNMTTSPAVLMEIAYHDNPEDAQWIKDNITSIAKNIVQSLTYYFDIPFIFDIVSPYEARVDTNGGNLNIREKPSMEAKVITTAPDNSPLLILGKWENWYLVNYDGHIGYAKGNYISS